MQKTLPDRLYSVYTQSFFDYNTLAGLGTVVFLAETWYSRDVKNSELFWTSETVTLGLYFVSFCVRKLTEVVLLHIWPMILIYSTVRVDHSITTYNGPFKTMTAIFQKSEKQFNITAFALRYIQDAPYLEIPKK